MRHQRTFIQCQLGPNPARGFNRSSSGLRISGPKKRTQFGRGPRVSVVRCRCFPQDFCKRFSGKSNRNSICCFVNDDGEIKKLATIALASAFALSSTFALAKRFVVSRASGPMTCIGVHRWADQVFLSELRQSRPCNRRVRGRIDVERKERVRVERRLTQPQGLFAPRGIGIFSQRDC